MFGMAEHKSNKEFVEILDGLVEQLNLGRLQQGSIQKYKIDFIRFVISAPPSKIYLSMLSRGTPNPVIELIPFKNQLQILITKDETKFLVKFVPGEILERSGRVNKPEQFQLTGRFGGELDFQI